MINLQLGERLRRWRARNALRTQLWSMDERQLSDIGIIRDDIEAVVNGHYLKTGSRPSGRAA